MLNNTSGISLRGDELIHNSVLDASWNVYYRYTGNTSERIDLSDLPAENAYLRGNTLRFFRTNDGDCDVDIRTGQEVKLAEALMENSQATVVLPNCIIGSTLIGNKTFDLRADAAASFPEALLFGANPKKVWLPPGGG